MEIHFNFLAIDILMQHCQLPVEVVCNKISSEKGLLRLTRESCIYSEVKSTSNQEQKTDPQLIKI